MLDRIENTVHQLHTITDSLAHDLRSPLTAIRGKLETALSSDVGEDHAESIVSAIDELDRLTEFLNTSLDVAEAKADALRLSRTEVDLDELVRGMIDLYEPSMNDKGLGFKFGAQARSKCWPIRLSSTASSPTCSITNSNICPLPALVCVSLRATITWPRLSWKTTAPVSMRRLVVTSFERRVKGRASRGHGLGLAFVEAVVRVHGGIGRLRECRGDRPHLRIDEQLMHVLIAAARERARVGPTPA
jgi:signal transduction histidine kinase